MIRRREQIQNKFPFTPQDTGAEFLQTKSFLSYSDTRD